VERLFGADVAERLGEIVQAPSWDQTWQVITTSPPWQWQFTTWLALFDHWQSLVAGVLAFVAAVIVVGFSELFAGRQRRREVAAIRASLAVEISEFIKLMIETHVVLTGLSMPPMRSSLAKFEVPRPTVYPATADRIGLLGPLAAGVCSFYTNFERINLAVRVVSSGGLVEPFEFDDVAKLYEQACRRSLPLLEALPIGDIADIRAKIEGMGKSNQPRAGGRPKA
jgi:hypothetical protein